MSVGTSLRSTTAERASKRAHHAYIALGFQKPHVVQSRAYPGWQQRESRSKPGKFFYYNPETDETRWGRPATTESLEVTESYLGSRSTNSLALSYAKLSGPITHEASTLEQPSVSVVHEACPETDSSTRSSRSGSTDGRDEAIQLDTITLPLQMARPTTTGNPTLQPDPAATPERSRLDRGHVADVQETRMSLARAPPPTRTDGEVMRPAQRVYQEESKPAGEPALQEVRNVPPAAEKDLEVRPVQPTDRDEVQAAQQTQDETWATTAPPMGGRPSEGSIAISVVSGGHVSICGDATASSGGGASYNGFSDEEDDVSATFGLTKDKIRWVRCYTFWDDQPVSQPASHWTVYEPYTHTENQVDAVKFLRHQLRRFYAQQHLANLGRAVRRKTEQPKMEDLSWLDLHEMEVPRDERETEAFFTGFSPKLVAPP